MPQRILNQQKLMLFLFVDSASYLKIQTLREGGREREREGIASQYFHHYK